MKNRTELAKHFNKLGLKIGVEVGVAEGIYSETLCKNIPGLKLFCVDPWGTYEGYVNYGSLFEKRYQEAQKRLAPYDCTFVKKMSVDAIKDFKDESLDFVYIDGNHEYSYVLEDISLWTPKVRGGGVVSGHDYYPRCAKGGVVNAVDKYVKENNYELKLTDWDKSNPRRDERQPSWYFYKNMKNRTELAKFFAGKGFQRGVEVGVARGIFSETLCKNIPNLKLYCVDPYVHYSDYKDFARDGTFKSMEEEARARLAPYNVEFVKNFSVEAAKGIEDESLDFVYIDGNHKYEYVRDDIRAWAPKVKKGGIVSGHDYYKTKGWLDPY